MKLSKKSIFLFSALSFLILLSSRLYAADSELALIYTGETHAMLYHCDCPVEPDGGISRRATLIKKLKTQYPNSLVLDSGNYAAAGLLDQNTQSLELDKQRTIINLDAMELMKYDALAISDDEFNFGKAFLDESIAKTKLNFISSNLKAKNLLPYLIKDVGGVKVGVIALTNPTALKKAGDSEFIDPRKAITDALASVRKNGATLVVLLSNMGEPADLMTVAGISGIDIIIDGHTRGKGESFTKVGDVFILRPSWQGRRLAKALLKIKDGKLADVSVEEIRVSNKVKDDPGVLALLPSCFSDNNCKKAGSVGTCQNPGTKKASCLFDEAKKVSLKIITSKDCATCNSEPVINYLKNQFPGINVSYLYYPEGKAVKLLKDLDSKALPVYLLGKEVLTDKNFKAFRNNLEEKEEGYLLKPEIAGFTYFFSRNKIDGRLDFFISLYSKGAAALLDMLKEFNPVLHFLVIFDNGVIKSSYGEAESEEYLRLVCMQKYYPQNFWEYLSCRAKNIESSWWEDCLGSADKDKIKICARGQEGIDLLKENSKLNQELNILSGPTYLLDNQEVFSSNGVPLKEEFKKIIRR